MINMVKVIIAYGKSILGSDGKIQSSQLSHLIKKALNLLSGVSSPDESLNRILGKRKKIGIKINTIGGKKISTRPELALSLAKIITDDKNQSRRVIIWDRTNRELKDAGYKLVQGRESIQVFGTDTQGMGYDRRLFSSPNTGSLFSKIQLDQIDASISLAILKDHGLAGVTAGMKNYFGAIHNPNKYHDNNCDPFIPEIFSLDPVRRKHCLTILDGLKIQFHKGPSFHERWASRENLLIFGFDPVAVDTVGWMIIEKLRASSGLPSLLEEGREPSYLKTSQKMKLGTALKEKIKIFEIES